MPRSKCRDHRWREQGFTLTEILIVAVIMTLAVAIAVPALQPVDDAELDAAAALVANAIQYARSEAVRTQVDYGIRIQTGSQRLRVFYVKRAFLIGEIPDYEVYDPLSRNLYDLRFGSSPGLRGVSIDDVRLRYGGRSNDVEYLTFKPTGRPHYALFGNVSALDEARFTIVRGDRQRVISVAPVTGKVTIL